MKRTYLALTIVALLLAAALTLGAGLGAAQSGQHTHDPRPTPTPSQPLTPEQLKALEELEALDPESPEAAADLPDLVVSQINVVPPQPKIGQTVKIQVTIHNPSPNDVRLGNNFYTDLYVDPAVTPIQLYQDGIWEWGCQSTWVPAGGSHVLETEYIFDDVKAFGLYAQVDTDDHVREANEANNISRKFTVQVLAVDIVVHETHEDFQMGMASSLDGSHPQGVLRRGIFEEPTTDPAVYSPDRKVDDAPYPPSHPNNVVQVKPALVSGGSGTLFSVWEDGRNGGVLDRDIYFSRSADSGATWSTNVQVNDDGVVRNQLSPDLAYDPSEGPDGRLYAVWQDGRNAFFQGGRWVNYDIYFSYSNDLGATWSTNQKLNDDTGFANQLNPTISIGPGFGGTGKRVYVVWQDQRNGNDDVYIVRSSTNGATWGRNYFVTDDPAMTAQNQSAPSVYVDSSLGIVYVAWEDWRDPEHPEIYATWSWDEGVTFGLDVPVTIVAPENRTTYRLEPAIAGHTTVEIVEEIDPVTQVTYTVETPVSVIHVAWEDWADGDGDVYYAYAYYDHEEPDEVPYPYEFSFSQPQEVSGFVIDSDYVLPEWSAPAWPIEPSWQGQVDLEIVPDGTYYTLCSFGNTEVYSKGVILTWSDARSYDEWRYEIRTRRAASPEGDPKKYELCEDWAAGMINGNPKIYALRDDPVKYEEYGPAAVRQSNPSIAIDDTGIYVAWDDDRYDDPSITETVRARDIFAAKMDTASQGIYISPVIDSGTANPQWYVLSWFGATEHSEDLLFQTRFGSDDSPPQSGAAGSGWTAWTGNPSSPYLGCTAGSGCYYDAPGRHVVDPLGQEWFDCPGLGCPDPYRYMQYKVIIRGSSRLTAVSQVTLHYEGQGFQLYLPLVLRQY